MQTSSGVSRSASAKAPRLDRRDFGGKKRARGPPARAESRRGKARSSGDAPLGKTMAMAFLLPREIISCVVARVDARVRRLEAAPGAGAVSRNSRARFARASLDVPAGHLGHRVAPPRAGARDARRTRAQGGVLF